MGSQLNFTPKIVFGPFEYDGLSGKLSKYGIPIRLHGKPLRILSALLNRPGEIVTRSELQRQLWGDTTFVDFEQGLNSAVNKLRQLLGDSADSPRYVETLLGQGYRFIAPLQLIAPVQRPSSKSVLEMVASPAVRIEPPPTGRFVKPHPALMAGVALAALAGGGYWLANRSAATVVQPRMTKWTLSPPSGFALQGSASRQSFALAPDGTRLAFTAADSTGQFSMFIRDFNSLETRLVPGSERTGLVFWPPDGRSAYMTVNGKLVRKPDETDAPITLADSPPFLHLGVWLGPNRILLDSARGSYFVSAAGDMEPLEDRYSWPQLLPDGEHLLYVRWNSRAGHFRARVASLTNFAASRSDRTDETNDLIETDSRVMYTASTANPDTGYLLYVRRGSLLARPFDPRTRKVTGEAGLVVNKVYSFFNAGAADFSVASRGTIAYLSYVSRSQLMWVDRSGRQLGGIGPADANVKTGRLSPDGLKMATGIYDVEKGVQSLWTFDVKTNLGRRLTADPGHRDGAVWSPDSTTLAFLFAGDNQVAGVHVRGLGQGIERAMPADGFQLPTDWSPDGRFVAVVNTAFTRLANEEQGDVCVLDLSREGKTIPLLNSRFDEGNPAFSPDGQWLAFTSNESGRSELYVQAFRSGDSPSVTGERYLVSRAGALAVRWRRDGREIFYLGFDGRVQAVPVSLSPKPRFGAAVKLFTIGTEARAAIHSLPGFDVSADGQRFIIPVVSPAPAPSIVVIHNWESLLTPKP